MGMFDTIDIQCPNCGKDTLYYQTKGGPCMLERFTLDNAPFGAVVGAMNFADQCRKCKKYFVIDVQSKVTTKEVKRENLSDDNILLIDEGHTKELI